MTIQQYLSTVQSRFASGISTEHSYRGDLQQLLETLLPSFEITNEPKRSAVGAPDFIITKETIGRGYIEAKDVDKSLDDPIYNKQFSRYKNGLQNLIITNYLEFRLYQDGNHIKTIHLACLDPLTNEITANSEAYGEFKALIKDFPEHIAQTIRSPKKLSHLMASKARLLKEVFARSLREDIADEHNPETELQQQYTSFKELLIRDISPEQFADLYAQTIAYGMFAARSKDPTLKTFNRQEAAELIPKTNPFLRKLFHYIAGYDLDTRLSWIIDGLAEVFRATDVEGILHNFGKNTRTQDPIIHFYEDFLKDYDPDLRVERGVYYTPLPVVQFIVRAVDDILKEEFNLNRGLADKSKIEIEVDTDNTDNRTKTKKRKTKKNVHRVQILDPATGTGTFLAQVVRHIYQSFEGMEGLWPQYVNQDLIPRLNGFEILMASYAMAHLKLDLLLQETGYSHTSKFVTQRDGLFAKEGAGYTQDRFNIFLTNTLEPGIREVPNLFWNQALAIESQEANRIKTQTPVMVLLGNPPYSGESANKGKYIMELMKAYKKEPGGKQKLQERNSKWLNDDYVKFIRFAENMIKKTDEGVVAYINPHGFLDNPTFRGMRWHLLKTFDKIYTIDLHGNAKKKETTPDGGKDDNVFDIQQGVSINLFVKTGQKKKNELGQVFHYDLYGRRKDKYNFLENNRIAEIDFEKLRKVAPDYFMISMDFELMDEYSGFVSISELFVISLLGPNSHRDNFAVSFTKEEAAVKIKEFVSIDNSETDLFNKFNIKSNRDWKISDAREEARNKSQIHLATYRLFDERFMMYGNYAYDYYRPELNNDLLYENVALCYTRQTKEKFSIFTTSLPLAQHKIVTPYDGSYASQLYSYNLKHRTPNLDRILVQQFAEGLALPFLPDHDFTRLEEALQLREQGEDAYSGWDIPEKSKLKSKSKKEYFTPLDILDYIYAVLHSPTYRERYKEFLKTDFPRVPWPKDVDVFWELVRLGSELRGIHLMKHAALEKSPVTYPASGDNIISRKLTKTSPGYIPIDDIKGRVWINDQQYFDQVPKVAWEFYIGGYQPAQKWLKDRKGRELTMEDIEHYRKIIKALLETGRLMEEIDGVEFI
ncbi:type ISP restriction/modification enzyme [Marixanthomonas spongiae]|uniref:site-specific DNA-methyltransferase (adenine-specific) n=1 Tax=Marixanthomonas spongiae TaxID=2174845 RepID=A0A2U0HUK2_9FLAO|nr:type ISP restriction/modification enzyme [Marixanthomonas spongiae]PVW12420.1 DNA methyltransferase [Marixanthomonas spongiae]